MIISHFINVTTQVLRYEGMLYSAHLSTLVHPNHSQPLPKGCLCGLLVLNGQLPNDGAGSVNQSTPRSKLGKVTEEKHMKPPWCSPPGRIARGSFPLTLCVHNADMANVCFFWGDISPLSLGHFHLAPSTAPSRRIYRPCLSVPSCNFGSHLRRLGCPLNRWNLTSLPLGRPSRVSPHQFPETPLELWRRGHSTC